MSPRVGADHAAPQDLAMAVCFFAIVRQQLGNAFVTVLIVSKRISKM
jgi:hypothetical protein